MKIKMYDALTEHEAIEKAKNELGGAAVILNIKKIQPRGIFKLFRKPRVEVVAAYEDSNTGKTNEEIFGGEFNQETKDTTQKALLSSVLTSLIAKKAENSKTIETELTAPAKNEELAPDKNSSEEEKTEEVQLVDDPRLLEQQIKIQNLEKVLVSTEELLGKIVSKISASTQIDYSSHTERKFNSTILQLFYDALIENEVIPEIARLLLEDLDSMLEDDSTNINRIVKIVYNRIVEILKQPEPIVVEENSEARIVVFIGPTGVGKTTTIAKLSSQFILNEDKSVGLITADTYRIAAVEQLRTYAEILNIEVEVVYNPEDLEESVKKLRPDHDIIFIDTAGRSHKNPENLSELEELLKKVPEAQRYLVLSATTKYNDLIRIIDIFSKLGDYKIIFTKIDETTSLGSILNVCYKTGKGLCYITDGQNVPDDIKIARPEIIAKALLGSFD